MIITAGDQNYILQERASRYFWEGEEALSLKTFSSGSALYFVENRLYRVNDANYLILNHGQHYQIEIDADRKVDSLCIFFKPGFVEETYRSFTTQPKELLENGNSLAPLNFFERTYPHDPALSALLQRLQQNIASGIVDSIWLEEQFHWIVQRLLGLHHEVHAEIEALTPVRAATREELYRRLHYARDYLAASFTTNVTLEEAAKIACLSPNYFLRTFKQTFHQTPHRYLISKRLEHAQCLLIQTETSVTDICFAVGFASLGTFSWLFRRRFGLSPEAYRRANR
jgi:AraC family transcriptional regulator